MRRRFAIPWAVLLLGVIAYHAVSAVLLEDEVARRIENDCTEWCGIDQAVHQISAWFGVAFGAVWGLLVAFVPRGRRGAQAVGILVVIGSMFLILTNLLLMGWIADSEPFWWVNLSVACLYLLYAVLVLSTLDPPRSVVIRPPGAEGHHA